MNVCCTDMPREILWEIFQYTYLPQDIHQYTIVCKQWHSILSDGNFWKQKVEQSSWLLNSIPPSSRIVSKEEYTSELSTLEEREKDQEGTPVKKKYHILYSRAQSSMLRSFNMLMGQWVEDWISYWASNFEFEEITDDFVYDSNSTFVFKTPMRLWESGIAHIPTYLNKSVANKQSSADGQKFKELYKDLISFCVHNDNVNDQQRTDDNELDCWIDPSNGHATSYPIVPFLGFDFNQDLTSDNFCKYIGAHEQLYKNHQGEKTHAWKDVKTHDTVLENHPIGEDHPIQSNSTEIHLKEIFSKGDNHLQQKWIMDNLTQIKFVVLGPTQMNPAPTFIIGKTLNNNLAGFCTATFRLPHQ
ncbi:hypothetical protein AKO1_006756 [Acrasis kona]|uniref:F-box domain-containing protein n=1 Tax=Acrasis kona TaxID=1008807 RepID=A0AAW2YUN6_9EUKA